ncbi:hypothetical protein [Streptomyces sp. NBC_01618]|uniref:hypothetical protein n=1 Tax=Streptomyces sp. NBC_01618 TaxID=2975900 RepID=UPI0038633945|nr:hypothetical protein OH735_23575 [Streptomyces sp. NBC_01618]
MSEAWGSEGTPQILLIESHGPCAPVDAGLRRDAAAQARAGYRVLMYLVEDGCLLARPGTDDELDRFEAAGGRLAVDRFSLVQRGLEQVPLRPRAKVSGMDELAGWITGPGVQAVWH